MDHDVSMPFTMPAIRFTLRTLLGAIALVSLLLGLIAARLQKGERQRQVVADLLMFEGSSVFALYGDYEYTPPPTITDGGLSLILGRGQRIHGFSILDEPSQFERYLVPLFGEYAFTEVSAVYWDEAPVTDEDLQLLARVPQLRELHISGTKVTDLGIQQITSLRHLVVLDLSSTRVTDRGSRQLSACSNLRELDLSGIHLDESVARKLEEALPDCDIAW